jgi:hypothetical protein
MMTEAEWLACKDPLRMLRSAQRSARYRKGERLWRLLACAAARRIWDAFDPLCRGAVELAERFADGLATEEDMQLADWDLLRNQRTMCRGYGTARWTLWTPQRGHDSLFKSVTVGMELARQIAGASEAEPQCNLIRDVFGNPFRPVSFDPAWLTPSVVSLAPGTDEERLLPSGELDPARLSVLSDALEEAGCTDTAILEHLRSPGPHVRGCWALDSILGKK